MCMHAYMIVYTEKCQRCEKRSKRKEGMGETRVPTKDTIKVLEIRIEWIYKGYRTRFFEKLRYMHSLFTPTSPHDHRPPPSRLAGLSH